MSRSGKPLNKQFSQVSSDHQQDHHLSNLFATIVRSNPIVVSAFDAATIVKAMANSPKSSGARSRARTTERTKPISCPISDDDTFQLTPERTLFTNGKFVVSAGPVSVSADGILVGPKGVIQSTIQARASSASFNHIRLGLPLWTRLWLILVLVAPRSLLSITRHA